MNVTNQNFRKTKIVATLGPACNSVEKIVEMINAGMNCARFNFSHGDHQEHKKRFDNLHKAMKITRKKVALLLDTKGPEIRTGIVQNKQENFITVQQDSMVIVSGHAEFTTEDTIALSHRNIYQELHPNTLIKIADGSIILNIVKIEGTDIHCKVIKGGKLSSKKNVNIPGAIINLPNLSPKDIEDIKFAVDHNYDYIAASFIRNASAVIAIRRILSEHNSTINIIAKIENQEGLDNIESIIQVADGIMIARGDLAEQIAPETVPLMQKHLIKMCLTNYKIAITATQMLQSMESSMTPTRAELTDVANAIFDGTDAIMLSGETAMGKYPIEAINTMHKVALAVETSEQFHIHARNMFFSSEKEALFSERASGDSIIAAAQIVADNIKAVALVCPSLTGNTPKIMSVLRPKQPIIATTHLESIHSKLLLVWGIYPIVTQRCTTDKELIDISIEKTRETGLLKKNSKVVLIAGLPINKPLMINTVQVIFDGTVIARGRQGCGPIIQGRFFKLHKAKEIEKHQKEHPNTSYIYCLSSLSYRDLPFLKDVRALVVEQPSEVPDYAIIKQFPNMSFIAHVNALMFQSIANEREIVISGTEKYIYEP